MSATKLGIWMDHQHAFITEFAADQMKSTQVSNDASTMDKTTAFSKGEIHHHTKEQQLQGDYYKKLAEIIKNYKSVVLYGPTTAKDELLHRLTSDHTFSGVRIHLQAADKMTENQRHAFVREYFTKNRQ